MRQRLVLYDLSNLSYNLSFVSPETTDILARAMACGILHDMITEKREAKSYMATKRSIGQMDNDCENKLCSSLRSFQLLRCSFRIFTVKHVIPHATYSFFT